MTNKLTVNHANRTIVMDRTFAKFAADTATVEYARLQQVRQDYPTYEGIQRRIRQNEAKKTYKGLTYDFMEDYILTHGSQEKRLANYNEFQEMCLISKCHGMAYRYPVIKSWFLTRYPEIANFGTVEEIDLKSQDCQNPSAAASTMKKAS